jgi:hypothetical protein
VDRRVPADRRRRAHDLDLGARRAAARDGLGGDGRRGQRRRLERSCTSTPSTRAARPRCTRRRPTGRRRRCKPGSTSRGIRATRRSGSAGRPR